MKFYRGLIAASLLAIAGVAQAQTYPTVTPLQLPALAYSYQESCTPSGFNADDSIAGVCRTVRYSACSGRGCQPVRYTYNYVTTWDINGIVLSAVACDVVRTHIPQVPQYTYFNGYTSCPVAVSNPNHAVTYVPNGPHSWDYTTYYWVATSDDGVYGLVDSAVVYPATAPVPQS